ncbi:MAG: glycosyltransferase family 4 protein, partial [bacterium]
YSKEKIIVAQNTIDVEKIIKNKSTIKIERNYELVRFLFVGALIKQKKLDKAITACKILSDKGYNFNFDIVGGGIIREDLELLINRYNLEEKVFIHGPKYGNEVIPFFERANVFLLPGTGGLAINEAMAHSLPIISTPGDGTVYDLVNIGINGFILEYNYSLEKLTSTMEYFIRSTPAKLKNMGNSSLMIIKEKGTMENMVDQFVKGIELFG